MDRLPAADPRRRARRLPAPYVVFQSNYDGPPQEYAEAFAIKVAGGSTGSGEAAIPRSAAGRRAFLPWNTPLIRAIDGPPPLLRLSDRTVRTARPRARAELRNGFRADADVWTRTSSPKRGVGFEREQRNL